MQICEKCKQPVRFIAIGLEKSVMCETEKITVITENGRKVEGYQPHKCKDIKDEKN